MEWVTRNRLAITRLLAEHEALLPPEAISFFELLLAEPAVLQVGRFCSSGEWDGVQNLIQIRLRGRPAWQARVGGRPLGAADPATLLGQLRGEAVWFLSVDGGKLEPLEAEPLLTERALRTLAGLQAERVRRIALLDQIDAALDAGDRDSYLRLQRLLQETEPAR
jgi:hypothetical protein